MLTKLQTARGWSLSIHEHRPTKLVTAIVHHSREHQTEVSEIWNGKCLQIAPTFLRYKVLSESFLWAATTRKIHGATSEKCVSETPFMSTSGLGPTRCLSKQIQSSPLTTEEWPQAHRFPATSVLVWSQSCPRHIVLFWRRDKCKSSCIKQQ